MPFYHGGHIQKDLYGAVASAMGGGVRWLLLDRFHTDRAAGAINGTLSEPSGHTRTLTDTAPNSVITGGQFKVTAVTGTRNPWLRYTTGWARVAGRMLQLSVSTSGIGTEDWGCGWTTTLTTPLGPELIGIGFTPTTIKTYLGTVGRQVASYTPGTLIILASILRSTGAFILVDGRLLWIHRTDSTATLFPHAYAGNADASVDFRLDNIGVVDLPPDKIPTPILSDTFSVPQIVDYGDNALHGTPVNVGLTGTEGKYNGTSSSTNIYSAGFNTLFSGDEGTFIAQAKVANVSAQYIGDFNVDANNRVFLYLNSSGTPLNVGRTAGGAPIVDTIAVVVDDAYHTLGGVWSKSADKVTAFCDGVSSGSPSAGLGVYAGALTAARIGSRYDGGTSFNNAVKNVIVAKVAASDVQMATIHADLAAGTLTKATLDGIFGVGNYVWYKHTEQYLSNGLAHVEADLQGANVAWNGSGHVHNAGNKGYITPTPGAELLTNGNLAAWTLDNPDGWGVGGEVGADPAVHQVGTGEDHTGAGTGSANFYSSGITEQPAISQNILTVGTFYRIVAVLSLKNGSFFSRDALTKMNMSLSVGTNTYTGRATHSLYILYGSNAAKDTTVDDVSVKALPFAQCLAAVTGTGEPYFSGKLTITANCQSGACINLDSYATPLYCVHVWYDRLDSKIYARKLVNGVWSADSLAGVAAVYSAAAYLDIRRIGNNIYVWYNGAYVGNFDAADVPVTNTLVARFNTDAANYHESVTAYSTAAIDYSEYD